MNIVAALSMTAALYSIVESSTLASRWAAQPSFRTSSSFDLVPTLPSLHLKRASKEWQPPPSLAGVAQTNQYADEEDQRLHRSSKPPSALKGFRRAPPQLPHLYTTTTPISLSIVSTASSTFPDQLPTCWKSCIEKRRSQCDTTDLNCRRFESPQHPYAPTTDSLIPPRTSQYQ